MSRSMGLRCVPLFASLSGQELQHLANSLARRIFAQGEIICHKGSVEKT